MHSVACSFGYVTIRLLPACTERYDGRFNLARIAFTPTKEAFQSYDGSQ